HEHAWASTARRHIPWHDSQPSAARNQCTGLVAESEMTARIVLAYIVLAALSASAQQPPKVPVDVAAPEPDAPIANPGRPTVATPATLTPVGYVQFETGVLHAWTSPEFSSQTSINEVVKFSVTRRIEFLAGFEPEIGRASCRER